LEKHSRQILALISAQRDLTLDETVWRFTSGESREVVARCPASSPVMALPSIKSLWAVERKGADVARAASKAFLTRPPRIYR
jgi:hypothetical protein